MSESGAIRGTPEEAPFLAAQAVAWARESAGVELDYTARSLALLDTIVEGMRTSGATEEDAAGLLYALGCYLGEVCVRHLGASWGLSSDLRLTALSSFPIGVRLADTRACNPIGKVFKRFRNGSGDSVAYFFHALQSAPAGR